MSLRHVAFFYACLFFTIFFVSVLPAPAATRAGAGMTLRTELKDEALTVPLALSFHQVVLERRAGTGWKPVAVQYPQSLNREQTQKISFVLPAGADAENYRVQGYRLAKFPVRFLAGKRLFVRPDIAFESVISHESNGSKGGGGAEAAVLPQEPEKLPLGWRTDRVLPMGEHLVQLEDGGDFTLMGGAVEGSEKGVSMARLRITPANDPDVLVEEILLGPGKVVGLSQKGRHVFIAQWVPATGRKQSLLRTWALDLTDPEKVVDLGSVEQDLHGLDAWDLDLYAVQPLWVDAETLVWFVPAQHHPQVWWNRPMAIHSARAEGRDVIPATSAVMVLCPVHFSGGKVAAKSSQVLRIRGKVTHTSRAFLEAGFVFFSHDLLEENQGASDSGVTRPQVPWRLLPGQIRSWLQVVDFRSGGPLLRQPVCIPGQLLNATEVDGQGAVLLTQSDLFLRKGMEPVRVVQASAYDGVNAYQLDTYVTASSFYSAAAADGGRLYLTRDAGRVGVVGVGYQAETGRFRQLSSWSTKAAPDMLHTVSGHLLASSPGNLEVAALAAGTGRLIPIASYDTPADLWLQVDRAAVTPALDIWVPAADYGVEFLQKQALGR